MAARLALLAAVVATILIPTAMASQQTTGQTILDTLNSGVLARLNSIRVAHGLVPLKVNDALTTAAVNHSTEMLADGYFEHESVDGAPFWQRLSEYKRGARNGFWSVGENLLEASPDVDATKALAIWMASPEHRQNILRAGWRDIGISAIHADSAAGTFGGRPVTVITTDFGVRR
jgi:uncharacterized protein YkwD